MKDEIQLKKFWFSGRFVLLLIGFFLMLLSNMRGSAGFIAWFMPMPFLIYVTLYDGIKNHLWLLLTLLTGGIFTLLKAASEPFAFSISFAILSGLVTGLRYYLAFLIWSYIRNWGGKLASIIGFPALIVTLEYLQAFYTPMGNWGSLANTQLYNLPLLQMASIFGFLGISALISWGAVLVASIILNGSLKGYTTQLTTFLICLIAFNLYGDFRLDRVPKGKHVLTAAIMSNYKFNGKLPSPHDPEVLKATDKLLYNTRKAAQSGAVIAVWGEGSTLVSPKGEKKLLTRVKEVAKKNNISVVAAYVVPLPKEQQTESVHMQNKFVWVNKYGKIVETYFKHHPVPGEGSVKGVAPLKMVHINKGNMAGAICYDYDFPKMAQTHARKGTDLVVIPGLDWRGMLRRHTLMTRIRAIEGGFSLLRAGNGASSMGFDNLGQVRAEMTDFGNNDKIMLASLPVGRTDTIYTHVGNLIAYIAILGLFICLLISGDNFLKESHKKVWL